MNEDRLDFFDVAVLYQGGKYKEIYYSNSLYENFIKSINNASKKQGVMRFPEELVKTSIELTYIRESIKFVKECMVYYGRKKIIDIPLEMIHIIPENAKIEESSVFGGIVIRRTNSDCLNAIKTFQKIFNRSSFRAIKNDENRNISLIDVGDDYKEAAASIISRMFYQEYILKSGLFKDTSIVEEECFSLEKEAFLNDIIEDSLVRGQGLFSKEKVFDDTIKAIVNGTIVSYIVLRDKKMSSDETNFILERLLETDKKFY